MQKKVGHASSMYGCYYILHQCENMYIIDEIPNVLKVKEWLLWT